LPAARGKNAGELRDGKLTVEITEHFADEDDARRAIDPFLRAWEIEADLNSNVGMIRFKFDRADLIDRDPPPPGTPQFIHAKAVATGIAVGNASLHVTYRKYPRPPAVFRTTTEVEIAYHRWMGYRAGKEPLQSMAYSILTLLESSAGGRKRVAQTFQIDEAVLDRIGKLSSTKGDARTARKFRRGTVLQELSSPEKQWLEQAIRRVIHRLGEHASGAPLPQITLTDLPKL
jgi:hypothetical protein